MVGVPRLQAQASGVKYARAGGQPSGWNRSEQAHEERSFLVGQSAMGGRHAS